MGARSAAASVARHVGGVAAEATLVAALVATVALAFSPVYAPAKFLAGTNTAEAGRVVATIAFDTTTARSTATLSFGDPVGFTVNAKVSKPSDLYLLWVANKCYQGGSLVSVEYLPVQNGHAGSFLLGPAPTNGGPQGNWSGGAASCTSYVWVFPDTSTPVRGASMTYDVAG